MDRLNLLKQLASLYQQYLTLRQATPNSQVLYKTALACLGKNMTAGTGVPYELGCAEAINKIHEQAFGYQIGGGASTAELYQLLLISPYFLKTNEPHPGDIIISPTGYGNGSFPGHVGIMGENGKIMSNSSLTGLFSQNYTVASWNLRYKQLGGFPVAYFTRL